MKKTMLQVENVTIRFAGDSGDGMQLTGGRFSESTAIYGNDLSTLPDYPAEIRAPAGSLAGVSAFQIHFSSRDIHTPGDAPDVLVAMNPAALKMHLADLVPGGTIIANVNAFSSKNLSLAGYDSNPLEEASLIENYKVHSVEMGKIVTLACESLNLPPKTVARTKNFLALGLLFWIYDRPLESTKNWLKIKFSKRPELVEANSRALDAGYNYGETAEIFTTRYKVDKAPLAPGTYRNINGNYAMALGLAAAAEKSGLKLFFGGYPITPASDILHTLAAWKHLGIKTFQAEDEIAGMASVIGASFAGNLAVTATSGPGLALKGEAIGLAVITELPMIIINVQRGGPSTGLPTKTEQADLMQALYGRNGEAPLPVIAADNPGDCFYTAYEACRVALKYMTPVLVLSDGYLANGSEPWQIPDMHKLPAIEVKFAPGIDSENAEFLPYLRDEKTLARPWGIPGTKGLEHRIGGLEKEAPAGNVSYDYQNHHEMTLARREKVNRIADELPATEVFGDKTGDLLILGWGGTKGAGKAATERLRKQGKKVGQVHLRWISPIPGDLGEILIKYKHILMPEINLGQLIKIVRAEYLVDAKGLNLVRGKPIAAREIVHAALEIIG
ncbi:MAG: 2-oxoacid:acceptor oxidoreductase subunit alpha [Candidatus Neomarinimicrobiota bacterium]